MKRHPSVGQKVVPISTFTPNTLVRKWKDHPAIVADQTEFSRKRMAMHLEWYAKQKREVAEIEREGAEQHAKRTLLGKVGYALSCGAFWCVGTVSDAWKWLTDRNG
jgi:hypothetical protein